MLLLGGVLLMLGSQIDGSNGGVFAAGLGCVVVGGLLAWALFRRRRHTLDLHQPRGNIVE
jgi:hypothetical protein